jgi:hypothetical protein
MNVGLDCTEPSLTEKKKNENAYRRGDSDYCQLKPRPDDRRTIPDQPLAAHRKPDNGSLRSYQKAYLAPHKWGSLLPAH